MQPALPLSAAAVQNSTYWLSEPSASGPGTREDAFRQGLRDLGYIEGKNIVIEYRWAAGNYDGCRASRRAGAPESGCVRDRGNTSYLGCEGSERNDPRCHGRSRRSRSCSLVASLAHPGGNITGLTVYSSELTGKRLEMLKEVLPRALHIGALASPPSTIYGEVFVRETEAAARDLGLQLTPQLVGNPSQFDGAFAAFAKEKVHALIVQISPVFMDHRKRIVELAAKRRLPAMYEDNMFPNAGGLMSYGPHHENLYRRAATYVDKILKGAKPADLPVEQPTRIRANDQSESRQANRPHDSAERAGAGR